MNSGIYKVQSKKSGKVYIGSAVNLLKRKSTHFSMLARGEHRNGHLQNAYNKYGKENFEYSIIEHVENKEDLIKSEQYHMDSYDWDMLYNLNPVAGSCLGRVFGPHSEETKKKLSLANTGPNNPNYGKNLSEETKAKIGRANKGSRPNQTSFKKGHKTNVGREVSKETREKLRRASTGKECSEETRRKISETKTTRKRFIREGEEYFGCCRCGGCFIRSEFSKGTNASGVYCMCKECSSAYGKEMRNKEKAGKGQKCAQ